MDAAHGADVTPSTIPAKPGTLAVRATSASRLFKALGNEHRLMILCLLASGEMSVTELQEQIGIRQPLVSQQLARLRADRLVTSRRDGKVVYYTLADRAVLGVVRSAMSGPDGFEDRSGG